MANTMRIQVENEHVLTEALFQGFDTSNRIGSNVAMPYTATQDCYFIHRATWNTGVTVDGVQINLIGGNQGTNWAGYVPLRKGQKIAYSGGGASNNVYAVKR